jgi:hypothetical protein
MGKPMPNPARDPFDRHPSLAKAVAGLLRVAFTGHAARLCLTTPLPRRSQPLTY